MEGTRGPVALDLNADAGDQSVVQIAAKAGDSVTLDVVVTEGGSGLNGFNVNLTFDPTMLAYERFATSDVFSGGIVIESKDKLDQGQVGIAVAFFGATTTGKDAGTMGQAIFTVLDGFSNEARVSLVSGQLATGGVAADVTVGPGGSFVVIGGVVAPLVPEDPIEAADIDGDGSVGFSDFITC